MEAGLNKGLTVQNMVATARFDLGAKKMLDFNRIFEVLRALEEETIQEYNYFFMRRKSREDGKDEKKHIQFDPKKKNFDLNQYVGFGVEVENTKIRNVFFKTGKLIISGSNSKRTIQKRVERLISIIEQSGTMVNGKVDINFVNIVASGNLKFEKLDLRQIVRDFNIDLTLHSGVQYEPERFPGIIVRLKKPKLTLLFFQTGKFVITGAQSFDEIKFGADYIADRIMLNRVKVTSDLNLGNLLKGDEPLTFLVGAGCSIDPPACLPAGRAMMEAIVDYVCPTTERESILNLEGLRFEGLVEIVRDFLDKSLKVIDYYGQSLNPNLQHFFLAEMIKQGQFVMTTNFDFLIESALIHSEIPKEDIIPVITQENFEMYGNPEALYHQGKKPLYKIHGSTKNFITKQSTRDSLIATIQAFGSNKEGVNIFQVETYKRPLFNNISRKRSLIVMGYSGSDDFDVVPTLKALEKLKRIIWVSHIKGGESHGKVHEIHQIGLIPSKLDKIDKILIDIKRLNPHIKVFRANVNTLLLVKDILKDKSKKSLENFSITPLEWLKTNIRTPSELEKYHIAHNIYLDYGEIDRALKCEQEVLHRGKRINSFRWHIDALNNIGNIFYQLGDYDKALTNFRIALKEAEQNNDLNGKSLALNGIGQIFQKQKDYSKALIHYQDALLIAQKENNIENRISFLNRIGGIHGLKKNHSEALEYFKRALKISEQNGNLEQIAISLKNIGLTHKAQKNYTLSLKHLENALEITDQLGNLPKKMAYLNYIGEIYRVQSKLQEALPYFEESLKISEKLEDRALRVDRLITIGNIHSYLKRYSEGIDYLDKALMLADQLQNFPQKARGIYSKGRLYLKMKNFVEALNNLEEALPIVEQLDLTQFQLNILNDMGLAYGSLKQYTKALESLNSAMQIAKQFDKREMQAKSLKFIGGIYASQADYSHALEYYEGSFRIYRDLGLENSAQVQTIKKHLREITEKLKK